MSKPNIFEEFADLFKDVKMCFCALCSHDPQYGHCYVCACGNHLPEPIEHDSGKLLAALKHQPWLIGLLREKVKS